MATINQPELDVLVWFASQLADALAASDQEIRVSFDDAPARIVSVVPRAQPRPDGGVCWQLPDPDPKDTVVYPDRDAAQAELAIMVKMIRDVAFELPAFDVVTIDPVPVTKG